MIENPIKKEYAAEIRKIKDMYVRDQEMRNRVIQQGGLIANELDGQLDMQNTEEMKKIILRMGWPTISKVGAECSNMAWLLVQHADHDVSFQKEVLRAIKDLPENEIARKNIAYLEDRVRVNEGRRQLYGTQFFGKGGDFKPRPIEDEENVERRRAEMGLEPMSEYAKKVLRNFA